MLCVCVCVYMEYTVENFERTLLSSWCKLYVYISFFRRTDAAQILQGKELNESTHHSVLNLQLK